MAEPIRELTADDQIIVSVREGSLLLDGVSPQTERIRGALVVAACAPDLGFEHRLLWGIRGDPMEACRALAHFLLSNPPVCDIVLGMVAIGRSGRLDGGEPDTAKGDGP